MINRDMNLEIENLLQKENEFKVEKDVIYEQHGTVMKYTMNVSGSKSQYSGPLTPFNDFNSGKKTFHISEAHQNLLRKQTTGEKINFKLEKLDIGSNSYYMFHSIKIKNLNKIKNLRIPFILVNYKAPIRKKENHFGSAVLVIDQNTGTESAFLPPAKVLAFWNDQFNNTNLATKDFEKRMQLIHQICNSSTRTSTTELLKLYTENLDKPIRFADEQAVKLGFSQFQSFADEQVGWVDPKNKHLQNLQAFYEKSVLLLEEELEKNKNDLSLLEEKLRLELESERTKEKIRTSKREKQNFEEEKTLNLKDVYKQLEIENVVGFTITESAPANVYNIDRFVEETTKERKTASYTDSKSGKTATITYNPFSLEVANSEQYDQLFVYLLPSKMNSFQRLNLTKGKLNYSLNNLMDYDVVVLGTKDNEYFVSTQKKVDGGHLGKLKLSEIRENALNRLLEKITRKREVDQPMSFKEELQWLKVEQAYSKFQRKKKEDERFIDRMRKIVFPCWKKEEDGK